MRFRPLALRSFARNVTSMAVAHPPREPLVAIMGTTGTGKSDLAVDLAARFNGEIINADAMQMYRGLPIITNQITEEEKRGIPHHFLATIEHSEPTWTVELFAREARKCIEDCRQRGKLPIVVGGTHYYINALLFESSLIGSGDAGPDDHRTAQEISSQFPILDAPTDQILQRLREVDPAMANQWHPSNRRKIRRSLEIFLTMGKRASDIYAEQQEAKASLQSGQKGPWETLIFWVYTNSETLNERLNRRVDKMVERGLLDEVRVLHGALRERTELGQTVDRTRGIWQSIGFKQLEPYLDGERAPETPADLDAVKSQCLEDVRTANRQYARYQLKFLRGKTIPPLKEQDALSRLFLLDSSDAANFSASVLQEASGICEAYLKGGELRDPKDVSTVAQKVLEEFAKSNRKPIHTIHCEVCDATYTSDTWEAHVRGRKHKGVLKSRKRLALVPKELEKKENP